jgi:2-oxo-4-hydroxy-4-carboxy-5-ureidoimidazoline decarboxylase
MKVPEGARSRTTLAELNALDRAAFVAALGAIYEHSPWVAEQAFAQRPFGSVTALQQALRECVDASGAERKLALLRAHPRLGRRSGLTASSQAEQTGAGLHAAAAEAQRALDDLNERYEAKFGFPFIIAVRGLDTAAIIAAAATRIGHTSETELREALQQVHRIAGFRLADLVAR